jgi:CelD/BcsL family acetyltransferase involved in cellulose biosynthesis
MTLATSAARQDVHHRTNDTKPATLQDTIDVELVTSRAGLERRAAEWGELARRSSESTLFETPEFVLPWLDQFWLPRPLAFLFLRRRGSLAAVMPFVADARGELGCRGSLVLAVNEHNGRGGIVREEGDREVVEAALRWAAGQRRRLVLKLVRSDSRLLEDALAAARSLGLASCRRENVGSPIVELDGSWDAFLASRDGHVRSELRRKARRLAATGAVRLEQVREPSRVRAAFADVLRVERASWKHAAGSAFSARPDVRAFYEALARGLAERGALRLYLLYLDEAPVAHLFAADSQRELWALMNTYDDSRARLSPGIMIAAQVFAERCAAGGGTVDLLGIEARWKNELATGCRWHATLCIGSRFDPRCNACRLREHVVKPFLKTKLPRLVAAWRALRRRR